jgi:hypothetical protein
VSPWVTQSADTDERAERVQFAIWRRMSAADKCRIVLELNEMTLELARQGIRERHPDADEREVFLRLVSTWLDRDTMIRAYGVDPEDFAG